MTRQRPGQAEETGDRADRREAAAELLGTAVLRLLQEGWRPVLTGVSVADAPRFYALLSPPHRASMSGPGGAQTPPAKEDEHG